MSEPNRSTVLMKWIAMIVTVLVLIGIAFGIAYLISLGTDFFYQDILAVEGLILAVIGMIFSRKGDVFGVLFRGWGEHENKFHFMLDHESMLSEEKEKHGEARKTGTEYTGKLLDFDLVIMSLAIGGVVIFLLAILAF